VRACVRACLRAAQRGTKVPRMAATTDGRQGTKKRRRRTKERKGGGGGRRGEGDAVLAAALLAMPAFYGPPRARGSLQSRDCDCACGAPLSWLRDASERAPRNREPRLIKRRRAIVNDPPRLVVKDRAGISRSVSRLPRSIGTHRSATRRHAAVGINTLVSLCAYYASRRNDTLIRRGI